VTTIRWAPQAADDLEAIRDFIARDSAHYAKHVVQRIVAAIEPLGASPRMGRVVPEMADRELRELIVGVYRVLSRYRHDAVEIVAILHGARQLKDL
jgi:toxin ParE1/3/4